MGSFRRPSSSASYHTAPERTDGLSSRAVGASVGRLVRTSPPVDSWIPTPEEESSREGLQSNRREGSTKVHAEEDRGPSPGGL